MATKKTAAKKVTTKSAAKSLKIPARLPTAKNPPGHREKYKRQPTERQIRMVQELAKGKRPTEAARAAGYSESVASRAPAQILPAVSVNFQEIMRKYCPADKIAKVIGETLGATTIKAFNSQGEILYSKPLIAHGERRAAAELAAKLTGYHADKQPEQAGNRLDELITAMKAGAMPRGGVNEE